MEQGLLAQAWGGAACWVIWSRDLAKQTGLPAAPELCLPWSSGLFPEGDIPEEVCRGLQEGRKGRKAKKRSPKCQLQNKTGRTSAH